MKILQNQEDTPKVEKSSTPSPAMAGDMLGAVIDRRPRDVAELFRLGMSLHEVSWDHTKIPKTDRSGLDRLD